MSRIGVVFACIFMGSPLYSYADGLWRGASAEESALSGGHSDKQKGSNVASTLKPHIVTDLKEPAAEPAPKCAPEGLSCAAEVQDAKRDPDLGTDK